MNNTSTTTRKRVQLAPAERFGVHSLCNVSPTNPNCSLGHMTAAISGQACQWSTVHHPEFTHQHYNVAARAYRNRSREIGVSTCVEDGIETINDCRLADNTDRRACTVAALEALGYEVIDGPETRPID